MVGQPQASHAYFTTMPPAFFAPYTGQLDRVKGASDSAHNERALKPSWAPRISRVTVSEIAEALEPDERERQWRENGRS